jgi:hypothetical protein
VLRLCWVHEDLAPRLAGSEDVEPLPDQLLQPDHSVEQGTGDAAIREQVASAVDLIVQQSRLKDGTRKIVNITEVQGMEGDVIVMQDVFVFEQTGIAEGKIQGRLKPTGIRPKFVEKFEVMGIHLPPGLFGFSF